VTDPVPRLVSSGPDRERGSRQLLGMHYATLAALLDATTFGHLNRLGIGEGWRCWEVGAGAMTVPKWLAERVGPTGQVLATDIDPSFLQDIGSQPFEVRRHDIAVDPVPAETFDLVHARLLLEHLSDPDVALARMVETVQPGGWLLMESADPRLQPLACPDRTGPSEELANRVLQACWTLQAGRTDLAYGRTLPRRLRALGLVDVAAEVRFSLAGATQRQLHWTLIQRARERLITSALVAPEEVEQHLADVDSGRLDLAAFPVVSAWGRKPLRAGSEPDAPLSPMS
jgi:SAM-dependent methyltransferase